MIRYNGGVGYIRENYIVLGDSTGSGNNYTSTLKEGYIRYYAQDDPRYGGITYTNATMNDSSQTIANSACGPTAYSIVVSTLNNIDISLLELCRYSTAIGTRTNNSGTQNRFFSDAATDSNKPNYNLNYEIPSTISRVKTLLDDKKHLVIVAMSPGHVTKAGHYIVLSGYTTINNEIYYKVYDPHCWNENYIFDGSIIDGDANDGFILLKQSVIVNESHGYFAFSNKGNTVIDNPEIPSTDPTPPYTPPTNPTQPWDPGTGNFDDEITNNLTSTPLSSSVINNITFPPRVLPDGTPITSENKENTTTYSYYMTYIYGSDKLVNGTIETPPYTMYVGWLQDTYGKNWLERFWSGSESFLYGICDSVVSVLDGLSYIVQHPIKTAEGMAFLYRAAHPELYPEDSLLLTQLIETAIHDCWNDFTEGDYNKKCRMIGRLVGEITLAIVSDKGISQAAEALKDTSLFSSVLSEVGKGSILADEVIDIFRAAGSNAGDKIRISQLKYALGRKGMSITKYELEYIPEIIMPDGEKAFAKMIQIGDDVLRGSSNKPLISLTDLGLSSMDQAIQSVFHEIHHIESVLKRGFYSSEDEAKAFARKMLKKYQGRT